MSNMNCLDGYYGSVETETEKILSKVFTKNALKILLPFMKMTVNQSVHEENIPMGRYQLLNDEIYASCEKVKGKGATAALLESHKAYYDIQMVLDGEDMIGIKPISEIEESQCEYNPETDCIFYKEKPTSFLLLSPGFFALFPPHICHSPLSGNGIITKLVIKVKTVYAL